MIRIDRENGYLVLSRCDYLYRDGLESRDNAAFKTMGDGDIFIPLPKHMITKEFDDKDYGGGRTQGSDGQSGEIIIAEIRKRLGLNED